MATLVITLDVSSPAATTITLQPAAGVAVVGTPSPGAIRLSAQGPLRPGTAIGTLAIEPPDWQGVLTASGGLTVSGMSLVVGNAALPVGSVQSTVTATP